MAMLRAALVGLVILCVLMSAGQHNTTVLAAADCTYTLGFRALHELIPDVIGDCETDAAPQPNGDVHQRSLNGLLVWRKADNWTAFTDGATTWVNGPLGIQSRPNDQLFAWEEAINAPEYELLKSFPGTVIVPPPGLEPFDGLRLSGIEQPSARATQPNSTELPPGTASYSISYVATGESTATLSGFTGDVLDSLVWESFRCPPAALYCITAVIGDALEVDSDVPFAERFSGLEVDGAPAVADHTTCCVGGSWTLSWYDQTENMTYTMHFTVSLATSFGGEIGAENIGGARRLALLAEELAPLRKTA